MTLPRLIEVALPIREISAESVRDKSLRHGHISTLHLWWARRPLPASRAVVFASLVPDPDHTDCPKPFRKAVMRLLHDEVPPVLKGYWRGKNSKRDADPYKPYKGIPDTPRNRLLAFIAKWSPEWLAFERGETEKQPPPAEVLDDRSLVKWETSNPDNEQGRAVLQIARELVRLANGGQAPTLLDPFAGGGAIPLEATRLGAQAIANDYNPVAYLILRATCEFPQKYGKPGERMKAASRSGRMKDTPSSFIPQPSSFAVKNVLAYDVEHWANWILDRARERIGHLYPPGNDGHPVVGYLWARTAPCSNPSCRAEIPLLRSLLVCNKPGKRVALTIQKDEGGTLRVKDEKTRPSSSLIPHPSSLRFGIAKNRAINETDGTMIEKGRGSVRCPICEQTTPVEDLRLAGLDGKMGERMVAVVTDTQQGKDYRPVESTDLKAFEQAKKLAEKVERPREAIPENQWNVKTWLYGMNTWGSLFNPRELLAMQSFVANLQDALMQIREWDTEYRQAVGLYLGLFVSRMAQRMNSVGLWNTQGEKIEHPFGRQAIPIVWDYPEVNPFGDASGGASGQIEWIRRVIEHEMLLDRLDVGPASVLLGDGARLSLKQAYVDAAVTDPPYFDAIAYSDLSDFFYIWLKRGLAEVVPNAFTTPLTPKSEEATAFKHHHNGDAHKASQHFTSKLAACFAEAKRVCRPDGILSIMFAHQSTDAWTALINALFEAGLTITATFPIDTERTFALKKDMSALASSITVTCRPRQVGAAAAFRDVRKEIEQAVRESVHRFWDYGFRGADLIVACYGPAVGVFGRYERVERADGTPVEVPELLELAREAALKAIAGEFTGDPLSRLYFVWANLYGTGEQARDDARLVVQMGGEGENAMEVAGRRGLFVVDGARCRLALLKDRARKRHASRGEEEGAPLIDQLHHAMSLWQNEDRAALVKFLRERDLLEQTPYWKLAQALFEVLPRGEDDWKLISALLGERENLRVEAKRKESAPQKGLFDE